MPKLNPRIKWLLWFMKLFPVNYDNMTPAKMRARMKRLQRSSKPRLLLPKVENRTIPLPGRDLPVRIYTPEGPAPFPALLFYHGGGFVLGDLDTYDSICHHFAHHSQCVVIAVDYRLAPEHKLPAALDDAYESVDWIGAHADEFGIDPTRIAVGGDSAGGNLAAAVCLHARDRGRPQLCYQLLMYPRVGGEEDTPSYKENSTGYMLDAAMIRWFIHHAYTGHEQRLDPYLSPALHQNLRGLPPALVVTAQFDPLRDSGRLYAEKLRASGVPATYINYEDMIHGFLGFHTFIPNAQRALDELAEHLRVALHPHEKRDLG